MRYITATTCVLLSLLASSSPYVRAADPILPSATTAPAAPAAGGGNNNAGNNAGNAGNAGGNAAGGAAATPTSSGVSIPPNAAAGGITITNPAQTADPSYYKIAQGVNVTFGWNFTSIYQSPTSLTVAAVNTQQSNTVTIATIPGNALGVVWSPWEYQQTAAQQGQPALAQATYRLQVYDERGPDAGSNVAGVFNPNSRVQFALYIPNAYTPLSEGWKCSGCNAGTALRAYAPVLIGLASSATVMLLSGAGLFSRLAGTA